MEHFTQNVNQNFNQFTSSQKKVANYILDHLETVAFSTLEELALKIDTSTTTVIRFTKVLGYKGYSEMQKDIQNGIKNKDTLPHRVSEIGDIPSNQLLRSVFNNEINNIQKTLAAQSEDDLDEVIKLIIDAKNVYIIGMRSSFSLAFYTASRLGQIKGHTHLVQSSGMTFPEEISGAKSGDICIVFLFPRYSKTTSTLVSSLKESGVKIILFTSLNYSILKGYGDIIIPCAVSEVTYKNSFAAPICIIDYIVAAVLQNNRDEAIQLLDKTERLLSQGYYLGLV
ncbi:MurR/RpiR family transcriptional regulator [Sporolactobacillus laevolacticus]|uniref:Transcriptional regulator n=1 Tax=Sporolactobacillus laevolacticus DSM 442 TaxID=1395513 RepID=V6IVR6_9BACL|nr:MurR/RpiR family transcriptional regulator [Sporolactobacillus laevolacticus]EST11343.1 transcriptional regulator [Sporolactobacillus laevolacticus DSM 442]